MKRIFFIIVGFCVGVAGVLAARVAQVKLLSAPTFSPQPISFTAQPPTQAIQGHIISVAGNVQKIPFDQDNPVPVNPNDSFVTGEQLTTDQQATATVRFADIYMANLAPNTIIDFTSGLPNSFLLAQENGTAQYTVLSSLPLSIRSQHLLVQLASGSATLITNQSAKTVKVTTTGAGTLAWTDDSNTSQVRALTATQSATFHADTQVLIFH